MKAVRVFINEKRTRYPFRFGLKGKIIQFEFT